MVCLSGRIEPGHIRKKTGPGQDKKNTSRVVIRGLAIFVIGLLFLLIIQGYEELWDWDILTFIGAMTIILLLCRKAPSWGLLLVCSIVLFMTPWLRSFIDLAPFYGGKFESVRWISDIIPNFIFDPAKDYQGGTTVLDNVLGFFLIGQFPLLPWIIFPLIGFVVGRRMTQNLLAADSPFILIIGMMFTFMGLFTAYAGSLKSEFSTANDYITPLSFYPNSFSMIMFLIGVVLILFISLWRIYDANPDNTKKPGMFLSYCRQISKYSLTIYISHFALFFYPSANRQVGNGNILFTGFGEHSDGFCAGGAFADSVLPLIETLGQSRRQIQLRVASRQAIVHA